MNVNMTITLPKGEGGANCRAPRVNGNSMEMETAEEKETEMEISSLMKLSNGLVQWSPCGAFLAVGTANRLTIRERASFQILQQYSAVDVIQVRDSVWSCEVGGKRSMLNVVY
jgi:hypothetical protein